jgi:hypothetical protein
MHRFNARVTARQRRSTTTRRFNGYAHFSWHLAAQRQVVDPATHSAANLASGCQQSPTHLADTLANSRQHSIRHRCHCGRQGRRYAEGGIIHDSGFIAGLDVSTPPERGQVDQNSHGWQKLAWLALLGNHCQGMAGALAAMIVNQQYAVQVEDSPRTYERQKQMPVAASS